MRSRTGHHQTLEPCGTLMFLRVLTQRAKEKVYPICSLFTKINWTTDQIHYLRKVKASIMQKKLALVTGASSGIGKELARYHAKQGGDLIISARRRQALDDLKAELEEEYNVKAYVFTSDLSQSGAAQELYNEIKAAGHDVDILINNAGLGGYGRITERKVEDEINMIMVNIISLVVLTNLFATDMAEKGGGRILNLGSTAGLMPGPRQAVYFASKAFVNSFSQAVDHELRKKGVHSTVLCPGYVETEFAKTANLEGTNMAENGGMVTAETTAKIGYDAMMKERLLIVNETKLSFLLEWVMPLMPRRFALKVAEGLHEHK